MIRGRRRRTGSVAVAVSIVVVCIVGIGSMTAGRRSHFGLGEGPIRHNTANVPAPQMVGQHYHYEGDLDALTVTSPPTNANGNIREVFWDDRGPFAVDQAACIDFDETARSQRGLQIQPGIALRIAPSGDGVKALAVEQNVYGHTNWIFWLHSWNSGTSGVKPFAQSFNVRRVVRPGGVTQPPPWHACAQVRDTDFLFKLWTGDNPEPAWDDDTHVFRTVLPAQLVYAGYSGGYIGHLTPGKVARFSDYHTVPLCVPPDVVDRPGCQTSPPTATSPTFIPSIPMVPPITAMLPPGPTS